MIGNKRLTLVAAFLVATFFVLKDSPAPLFTTVVKSNVADVDAITGGTLIDGSGRAPVNDAVVIIKGDSIAAVGRRGQIKIPIGARVIDARGLIVAPGFIDTHNHSDRGFAEDPSAATQVSQGITTVAVGQDGGSAFPVGEFLVK